MELLLSHRADVDILDEDSATALFSAAAVLPVGATEALLAAGAMVNWQDDFGVTALYSAYDCARYPTAMLLLRVGADVHLAEHQVSAASSMHSIAPI